MTGIFNMKNVDYAEVCRLTSTYTGTESADDMEKACRVAGGVVHLRRNLGVSRKRLLSFLEGEKIGEEPISLTLMVFIEEGYATVKMAEEYAIAVSRCLLPI